MTLSREQKENLKQLCRDLSLNSLVELKKGNIEGIKDFNTKLIDPDLIREHKEMKEIIKKEIMKRNMNRDKNEV